MLVMALDQFVLPDFAANPICILQPVAEDSLKDTVDETRTSEKEEGEL